MGQLVALGSRQWLLRQAFAQQAQVVDFLVNAKALLAGQGQWGALFARQQSAAARLDGFEWALVPQAVFEFGACRFMEQLRVELGLLGPERIELGFDHGAVNVEVVDHF